MTPFIQLIVTLALLLVGIMVVCEAFTNAIEWVGERFNLSEGTIGSILAAVGTALPETIVPIVALVSAAFSGGSLSTLDSHDIGVGAILGAPFLLSTLAFFLMGAAAWLFNFIGKRKHGMRLALDLPLVRRDLRYFFISYLVLFLAGLLPASLAWAQPLKYILAVGLLGWYGLYVYKTVTNGGSVGCCPKEAQEPHTLASDDDFHLPPLWLAPKTRHPATWRIVLQVVLGISGIVLLAHAFVGGINQLAHLTHVPTLILSLIIIPIATELPEKFNSVSWISRDKDNLAMGNVTGAMVFQSCIPGAIGLAFTPWHLSGQGLLSVFCCLLSTGLFYTVGLRKAAYTVPVLLLAGGVFYTLFLTHALGLWSLGVGGL